MTCDTRTTPMSDNVPPCDLWLVRLKYMEEKDSKDARLAALWRKKQELKSEEADLLRKRLECSLEESVQSFACRMSELETENNELKLELLRWNKKVCTQRLRLASEEEDSSINETLQKLVMKHVTCVEQEQVQLRTCVEEVQALLRAVHQETDSQQQDSLQQALDLSNLSLDLKKQLATSTREIELLKAERQCLAEEKQKHEAELSAVKLCLQQRCAEAERKEKEQEALRHQFENMQQQLASAESTCRSALEQKQGALDALRLVEAAKLEEQQKVVVLEERLRVLQKDIDEWKMLAQEHGKGAKERLDFWKQQAQETEAHLRQQVAELQLHLKKEEVKVRNLESDYEQQVAREVSKVKMTDQERCRALEEDLEKRLHTAGQRWKSLEEQLNRQLLDKNGQLEKLQQEVNSLQRLVSSKGLEVTEKLRAQHEQSEELQHLRGELVDMQQRLAERDAEHKVRESALQQQALRVAQLTRELEESRSEGRLKDVQGDSARKEAGRLEELVKTLQREVDQLRIELQKRERQEFAQVSRSAEQLDLVGKLQGEVRSLRQTVMSKEDNETRLEHQAKEYEHTLQELRHEVSCLRTSVGSKEAAVLQLQGDLQGLKKAEGRLTSDKVEQEQLLRSLRAELVALKDRVRDKDVTIAELQRQLKEKEASALDPLHVMDKLVEELVQESSGRAPADKDNPGEASGVLTGAFRKPFQDLANGLAPLGTTVAAGSRNVGEQGQGPTAANRTGKLAAQSTEELSLYSHAPLNLGFQPKSLKDPLAGLNYAVAQEAGAARRLSIGLSAKQALRRLSTFSVTSTSDRGGKKRKLGGRPLTQEVDVLPTSMMMMTDGFHLPKVRRT